MADGGRLRIGELSRRVGESPELLRAWEGRYGLVAPERTPGGLRLYSEKDEQRVRAMRQHINAGLSASEAARLAKLGGAAPSPSAPRELNEISEDLKRALDLLDEPAAQLVLDRLLGAGDLSGALGEVILPFLHELGVRWASGELSVAQEHFASNIIGGRLRARARGWGSGVGPVAVLACPPGELHDLGLLSFGLALRERGWRINYLGADTPLEDIGAVLDELFPAIVVLAATTAERFLTSARGVRALAARTRVGIGGAGANPAVAHRLKAELLAGDLIDVAAMLEP